MWGVGVEEVDLPGPGVHGFDGFVSVDQCQWMFGLLEGGRKICLLQLMGSIPVWIAAISLDAWLRESFFREWIFHQEVVDS